MQSLGIIPFKRINERKKTISKRKKIHNDLTETLKRNAKFSWSRENEKCVVEKPWIAIFLNVFSPLPQIE